MPFLSIQKRNIFYNDTGAGEPLILLHNGFYSTKTWDPVRARLAERFRVLDYDRFGYGKSDHLDGDVLDCDIIEESAKELEGFLDALGIERAHLAGHCLGGAAALMFASRNKNRVGRIVVSSVGFFGSARSILQTDMTFVPFDRIDEGLRKRLKDMHGEDYAPHLWTALSEHRGSYIMSDTYDLRAEVRKVRCPMLIINGDRDFYFDVEHPASIFKKMRRTARLWIVPGCGHDVHMEKPDDFVQNVLSFLLTPV